MKSFLPILVAKMAFIALFAYCSPACGAEDLRKAIQRLHPQILRNKKLIDAVKTNNFTETANLLVQGADPNIKTLQGETLLNSALSDNNGPIVRLLLAHGADPNLGGKCLRLSAGAQSIDPLTCYLTPAIGEREWDKNPDIVQLLIEKGTKIESTFEIFISLSHLEPVNIKNIPNFLNILEQIYNSSSTAQQSLSHASRNMFLNAVVTGNFPLLNWLIKKGTDIKNIEPQEIADTAIMSNNTIMIQYLLNKKYINNNNFTDSLLRSAVANSQFKSAMFLIKKNVNIALAQNWIEEHPELPIQLFVSSGKDFLDVYMQLGNNINKQDTDGNTFLLSMILTARQAQTDNNQDAIPVLTNLVKTLLNYRSTDPNDPNQVLDLTIINNAGQSALSLAEDAGTPMVIRSLIQAHGVHVNE